MNNFVQSWRFLVPFVAVLIHISSAARSREVYEYDECRAEYQEPLGAASGKIPDESFWASTSTKKRPPSQGRLGIPSGAWTAGTQNTAQYLAIDLGARYMITSVATQGRQGSDEYVVEYFIEYSDDRKTWRIYTNEYGIPEMFDGNTDSSQTVRNTLLYPIVCRYIRFSPQRWSMFISMRVEVTGCLYESYVASFNSKSYIQYDLSQKAVPSEQNLLELRFKTSKPDGVLFYASGNQGDYITLEMKRGFLYFRIDLGSTQTSRGRTEVVCGSLLDDHQWHDVVITRNKKSLKVVVDRLMNKLETNGLFYRLDLDKYLYVGGLPYFGQDGVEGKYSFVGCVENVNFDGAKLIKDARDGVSSAIQRKGSVSFACGITTAIPVTFTHSRSYMKLTNTDLKGAIRVGFDFRTHDENGFLVSHAMGKTGLMTVRIDANGYIAYKVVSTSGEEIEDVVRNTDVLSKTKGFSDGLWHTFSIHVDTQKINCTVDRNSKLSSRSLKVATGDDYYIGSHDLQKGFRGCLRNIQVASKIVHLEELEKTKPENLHGLDIGSCGIRDRCTPNPCEHGGNCSQDWDNFYCRCDSTGYKGELCHISGHHISCIMQKLYSKKVEGTEEAVIDVDGSGPLKPFKVICETDDEGKAITYVGHDSLNYIQVNGYQEPGSYVRLVRYNTDLPELTNLIERASSCQQYIEYQCFQSKLLNNIVEGTQRPFGWWVGRTYQPMYYWGGAAPGSFKCACGLDEKGCVGQSDTCNCDASLAVATADKGYLVHKDYLPVLEMHFGDTGTVTDTKVGSHKLGSLECTGDDLFDNVITFRKADATLEFATFEAEKAGDIWFQFRTTADSGIMIHNTGLRDFIEVRLFQSDNVRFRYDVGDGQKVLNFKASAPLDNDAWHTVHVEHNRKQAWMRIDDSPEVFLNENSDLIRMLDLNGPLVIGAAVDGNDGFVGCMRGLRVNGILLDMKGKLEREEVQYGVSLGCVGKCSSSPCFNGGTCREGYSGYTCDCSYTPFRGWMCGREVGVNLQKNYMIRYTFENEHGLSASDFEFAQIGFTTQMKQGYLMQMRNEKNTEYISVEINNAGGVTVAMDVGFERVESQTPDHGIDYTNGQQHVVVVKRSNKGRTLFIQVDNYPSKEVTYPVSESSDTILDDPKYVFIGNNDTSVTSRGFEGCIFQMRVDNIFPLKRAFQDPRPSYMYLEPEGKVREDMCGFEEYTQPPDPIETRPRGGEVINVTYPYIPDEQLSTEERIILGVVLALVFIIVILIIIFLLKNKMCEGGDYSTKEAKGAELADNPDTAVVYNQTGLSNIADKQEWFL